MDCYRFEKKMYDKGFLDDAIDATFIIHLESNGRFYFIHIFVVEFPKEILDVES